MKNRKDSGKIKYMQIEISEENLYLLLSSAIRYAMGRMTYGVSVICGLTKQYTHFLSKQHKEMIQKNINDELERYEIKHENCGHEIDHKNWQLLAEFLQKNNTNGWNTDDKN